MRNTNKPKLWYRIRGLDTMEKRFGKSRPIESFIKERLKSQKVVRVLELGFGEGKCLLDLRTIFPDKRVELYGVNDIKKGNMHQRKDFAANAGKFGLSVPKPTLLPKPFFYDAGNGLKFKSNYFDVIISQVAFPYVGDKAKLIEEFWRVLKPQGRTFVHIDDYKKDYPDFLQINKETPRFVIYDSNKLIKLSSILNKFRKKQYDIRLKKNKHGQTLLLIKKNKTKSINLGLIYVGDHSFDLTKFNKEKNISGVWWGNRSVFKTK
ncbi:class I SAM-dependent methyltransferase [Candidatus Woesearchaeota archaeon]|nr:class I SAM-dependent methyltransferase [Candidatus Woesearchaeota archaeon]